MALLDMPVPETVDIHPPSPLELRRTVGRFATGVAVVGTTVDSEPFGMTVNAFTSLSLTPPLVLVCIRRGSRFTQGIIRSRAFAISVLSDDQFHIARFFSQHGRPSDRQGFEEIGYQKSPLGAPLISGALAYLDCSLYGTRDGGDHVICLGLVEGLGFHTREAPLLFSGGRFGQLGHMWHEADESDPLFWPWS